MLVLGRVSGWPGLLALTWLAPNAALSANKPFDLVRSDETYAHLRDPALRRDLADAIKYVPLGPPAYLSLGAEWRERYESVDAARFGIGASQDAYLLQRVLLHADLHMGDQVRIFGQIGQEDAFGKARLRSTSDVDRLDLQNLFIDWRPSSAWRFRVGRQEMLFNPTQRFVSVREGPNVRQSFDGSRVTWTRGDLRIDGFVTRPVLYQAGAFDNASDRDQAFYGLYASKAWSRDLTLDAYMFGSERNRVRFGSRSGNERRVSLGVRVASQHGPVDFDAEGLFQSGAFAGQAIRAWGVSAITGYTLARRGSPRLGLEIDAGSGDRDGGDGKLGTFNPLFPKGAYFNEVGLTSWTNTVLVRPSLSVSPSKAVTLQASLTHRWRTSLDDGVYLQPYVLLAGSAAATARDVGGGWRLDASWKASRNLSLSGQVFHQSAGPAIRQIGGHPVDAAVLIAQVRF